MNNQEVPIFANNSGKTAPTPVSDPTQPAGQPAPVQSKPAKNGLLSGIFGSKKAKKAAAVAEAALAKMALHSIADGVIIVDKAGKISLINPSAVKMTNAHAPEVTLGLSFDSVITLETLDSIAINPDQDPLYDAVRQGKFFTSREYISVNSDNHKTPISITVTPVHSDKIITFRDITKELEEEGEQAEFISTASHEMRTPVASIEGYIGLALNPQTATIDDRARQYLDAAHSASQHLGHLFKDLLDVTKLDDHKLKLHPVPVELTELVAKMVAEHTETLADKTLKLTFGTPGSKKAHIRQPVYVSVDVDFLREVLDNLMENAIKYTPEGGAVWVNVRADGDEALINVTDTGIGIAPDELNHIFQKFYRVDNSQTRTIGGTGLGLYIVKQRVEAMEGRVWAESSFGDGSTFYVALPRLSEHAYERAKLVHESNQAMGLGEASTNATNLNPPVPSFTPIPAPATSHLRAIPTPATPVPPQQPQPIQPQQPSQATPQPQQPPQVTPQPQQPPQATPQQPQPPIPPAPSQGGIPPNLMPPTA